MTVFELFAGAGGAALGLHRAGLECVGLVEHDPDACATLRAAGLGPVLKGDAADESLWRPADVLWASPPCQPFSQAGKRAASDDSRNGWPIVQAYIERMRPAWVIVENVPGLTMGSLWPYFSSQWVDWLEARYQHVRWTILDAADYGVPQHRRRVFVVAGPCAVRWPVATHCDPSREFLLGMEPWVTCGEALGLSGRIIGAGTNPHSQGAGHERTFRDITGEPAPTVAASLAGNRGPWVDWSRRESPEDEPPRTIGTKGNAKIGVGPTSRTLTVEECGILQGFPPDYPWQGRSKKSRYRQVGNAVPPIMAELIGRQVAREVAR